MFGSSISLGRWRTVTDDRVPAVGENEWSGRPRINWRQKHEHRETEGFSTPGTANESVTKQLASKAWKRALLDWWRQLHLMAVPSLICVYMIKLKSTAGKKVQ